MDINFLALETPSAAVDLLVSTSAEVFAQEGVLIQITNDLAELGSVITGKNPADVRTALIEQLRSGNPRAVFAEFVRQASPQHWNQWRALPEGQRERFARKPDLSFLIPLRTRQIKFLQEQLTLLKRLLSSRYLATQIPENDPDKAFLRVIVGGLDLFMGALDDKSDAIVAGRYAELKGQLEDAGIQKLLQGAGLLAAKSTTEPPLAASPTSAKPAPAPAPAASPPAESRIVALLKSVAAQSQTGITLQKGIPSTLSVPRPATLILDSKLSKFAFETEVGRDASFSAVARPAMTAGELLYEESGVTTDNRSILVFSPSVAGRHVDIKMQAGIGKIDGFILAKDLVKAKAVVDKGLRKSVVLILFNTPGVTPWARRFFFNLHPQGTLIVWHGTSFHLHRLESREGKTVEVEIIFEIATNKKTERIMPFVPVVGELRLRAISLDNKDTKTIHLIEQPVRVTIRRLKNTGKNNEAQNLQEILDRALRAVGFLPPEHSDVLSISRLCQQLSPNLAFAGVSKIIGELKTVVDNIERRLQPGAPPTPAAPSAPPPDTASTNASQSWAILRGLSSRIADTIYDATAAIAFLKVADRVGDKAAVALAETLSRPCYEPRYSYSPDKQKSVFYMLADICDVFPQGTEKELTDWMILLGRQYSGSGQRTKHRADMAYERLYYLHQAAKAGKPLVGIALLLMRSPLNLLEKNFADITALTSVLGEERRVKFAKYFLEENFANTGLSEQQTLELGERLLSLSKKGKEEVVRGAVDQLLESKDKTTTLSLFKRVVAVEKLSRQDGIGTLAKIVLQSGSVDGVEVTTDSGKTILILAHEAELPLEKRDEIWRKLGVKGEIRQYPSFESNAGHHYTMEGPPKGLANPDYVGTEHKRAVQLTFSEGKVVVEKKSEDQARKVLVADSARALLGDLAYNLTDAHLATFGLLEKTLGSRTDARDVVVRLATAWDVTQQQALNNLGIILQPPAAHGPAVPVDLKAGLANMLGGKSDDKRVANTLETIRFYHRIGFVVTQIGQTTEVKKVVRIVREKEGGLETVEVDGAAAKPSVVLQSTRLSDDRLIFMTGINHGQVDFTSAHVRLINNLALAKQLGHRVVLVVNSPEGITERSLRLFWSLHPQGEVVWVYGTRPQSGREGEALRALPAEGATRAPTNRRVRYVLDVTGEEISKDLAKPGEILSRRSVAPQTGDIVLSGLTENIWQPDKTPWAPLFETTDSAKQIWTYVGEILGDQTGLERKKIGYDGLLEPCTRLTDGFNRHRDALRNFATIIHGGDAIFQMSAVASAEGRFKEAEVKVLSAFESGGDIQAGTMRVRHLPSALIEARKALRQMLAIEVSGYLYLLARLEKNWSQLAQNGDTGKPFPEILKRQQDLLKLLQGRLSNEAFILEKSFFAELDGVRGIMQIWIPYLNREPPPKQYEFESEDDLELPPRSNLKMKDFEEFLKRYGFEFEREAEHADVYVHRGTDVRTGIERIHPKSFEYALENGRPRVISAVIESLRKEGRMAPAAP